MLAYILDEVTRDPGDQLRFIATISDLEDVLLVSFQFQGSHFTDWAIATATVPDDPFFTQDCLKGGSGRVPAQYPATWRGVPLFVCVKACLEAVQASDLSKHPLLEPLFTPDICCWPEQVPNLNWSQHFTGYMSDTSLMRVDFMTYCRALQRQFSEAA